MITWHTLIKKLSIYYSKYLLRSSIVLSSICFGLAWNMSWLSWLLFVALVPLFFMVDEVYKANRSFKKVYLPIFAAFLLWNVLTIWWLYYASWVPLFFVSCYNGCLLSCPFFFYHVAQRFLGPCRPYIGYIAFIASWLTVEHAHYAWPWWELTFPWLNLGNGLANLWLLIQWYEYTGVLGGSLWILSANILLYHYLFKARKRKFFTAYALIGVVPIFTSIMLYYRPPHKGSAVEAILVQPNLDSYTQKNYSHENFIPHAQQIDLLINLSRQQITPNTQLIIWPESAIDLSLLETAIDQYSILKPIFKFIDQHAHLNLITGVGTFQEYGLLQKTKTAYWLKHRYVDCFNSIMHYRAEEGVQEIYHKNKRLPGGEYIPYFHYLSDKILKWMKKKFMEIGNLSPTYAAGEGTKVFHLTDAIRIAPVNCYESLYGAFVGTACQKGANLLTVLTNDGWWGNTPIYRQHLQYSRILAIAHRKYLLRSANTGISASITPQGRLVNCIDRLSTSAIKTTVYTNNQLTFYSTYGDYIGYIALLVLCLLLFVRFIHFLYCHAYR